MDGFCATVKSELGRTGLGLLEWRLSRDPRRDAGLKRGGSQWLGAEALTSGATKQLPGDRQWQEGHVL